MAESKWFSLCVGLLLLSLVGPANAQSGKPNKITVQAADDLFQKAQTAMIAGRYDEACEALDASNKLDPKAGTLFALGDCEATRGKPATAIDAYKRYLEQVAKMDDAQRKKHEERATIAKENVEKKLPAEILFNQAKESIAAGRVADACEALSHSLSRDPTPGTVFALADCEVTLGELATALGRFTEYLKLYGAMKSPQREKHTERARIAEERRKQLEVDVPRVKLIWMGEVPAGLAVIRDGDESKPVELGVAFAVDPGDHVFVTRMPGKPEVTRKLRIGKGERKVLELRPGETKEVTEEPRVVKTVVARPKREVSRPGMHPYKVGGLVLMGLGGAGLVAGAVTGVVALQQKDAVDSACPDYQCKAGGLDEVDKLSAVANTSTLSFALGGAAVGAGLLFFLLAPKQEPTKPAPVTVSGMVVPGSGFLGIQGVF